MLRDTTTEVDAVRLELYRRMSPGRRGELAAELSELARELARAGIRSRHSGYDARQVELALYRLLLGDELFSRTWPGAPLLDP